MIQSNDGILMLKGNTLDLLNELGAIIFALTKKRLVPDEVILGTVKGAIAKANEKDSDEIIETIIDQRIKRENQTNPDSKTQFSDDLLKKMFGDLLDE